MRAVLRSPPTTARTQPRMRASRAPRRQDHRPSPTAGRLGFRHDLNSIVAPHDARITIWSKSREFGNTGSDGKFLSAGQACDCEALARARTNRVEHAPKRHGAKRPW